MQGSDRTDDVFLLNRRAAAARVPFTFEYKACTETVHRANTFQVDVIVRFLQTSARDDGTLSNLDNVCSRQRSLGAERVSPQVANILPYI